MRKINKTDCLAKEYYVWQKTSKSNYYSSHKYYKDVLVSLINCQEGLCAYTEYRLIDKIEVDNISKLFDSSGKYSGLRPEIPMDIEHFDSSIKEMNGWSWNNLFGVYSPINRDVKRVREAELIGKGKKIQLILKPDSIKYEPCNFLQYSLSEHIFYPNPKLDLKTFEEVKNMIYVLGLNWGYIKTKRKEYISEVINKLKYTGNCEINQFYTAIQLLELL